MKKYIIVSIVFQFFLYLFTECFAQDFTWVEGYVYEDIDQNGKWDKREKCISGIAISNGDTVLTTDRRGHFRIRLFKEGSVFPILPNNMTLLSSKITNAGFYNWSTYKASEGGQIKFGLSRKKVNKHFSMNAIGDVQIGTYQELDYAARSLWPELLQESSSSFNLFLGDLVNNRLELFSPIKQMMEQLPTQSWTVIGNHDRNVDSVKNNQIASYNATFGSDIYAFNEGNAHFIVLNNVYGTGKSSYIGKIADSQMRFVENDLKYVPQGTQLVFCMHIPLAYTTNSSSLLKLLEGRGKVLALTGHMHQVERNFLHGRNVCVHELVVGASCGFWWVGEKDWEGLPSALMQCGTPRNYFVFNFAEREYSFRCKGIGLDDSRQMNIAITGIDSTDVYIDEWKDKVKGEIFMTIYGASDSTMVRCCVDDGEWLLCEKKEHPDINVARMRSWNQQNIYPTRFSRRNPFRRRPSPQLWKLELPNKYCRGVHSITVEASDSWGFHAFGKRIFCY